MGATDIEVAWEAFAPSAIDERVDAFNRMTAQALRQVAPLYTKPVAQARAERAQWARAAATAPDAAWLSIPSARSALQVRALRATSARGLYLHVHGGGWVLGGADHQDPMLHDLRTRAQVTVYSVEYRLSPEHPFPAAVEDVEDALRFLLDAPQATPLVVGGESAGANLAAVALLRLRDHPNFGRVRAACLHYGTFDLSGTPSLLAAPPGTPFLDRELAAWFRAQYAPEALHRHPEVSPLYADLRGLPRTRLLVGSEDPVRDDTLFMHSRLRSSGNTAALVVYPGGLHGLLEWNTPLTRRAREELSAFVTEALGA